MEDLKKSATAEWLKEQGAKGLMSPANVTILGFGPFRSADGKMEGAYPVVYVSTSLYERGAKVVESWFHYDQELSEAPSRQQCLDWALKQK